MLDDDSVVLDSVSGAPHLGPAARCQAVSDADGMERWRREHCFRRLGLRPLLRHDVMVLGLPRVNRVMARPGNLLVGMSGAVVATISTPSRSATNPKPGRVATRR